jgi:hypothetical protein
MGRLFGWGQHIHRRVSSLQIVKVFNSFRHGDTQPDGGGE